MAGCVEQTVGGTLSARLGSSPAVAYESSHVLCMTMVCTPPMKMSAVYSSIARLLSPTWSGLGLGLGLSIARLLSPTCGTQRTCARRP